MYVSPGKKCRIVESAWCRFVDDVALTYRARGGAAAGAVTAHAQSALLHQRHEIVGGAERRSRMSQGSVSHPRSAARLRL